MTSLASKQNSFVGKIKETNLPTKWIAPKKPPFREDILQDKISKEKTLNHHRQQLLDRYEKEKLKNTFKKQLCVEMLKDGYHKSFRELDFILKLQIQDRYRVGSEHPVWDRPLLDNEHEKLEYLCNKLTDAESSERTNEFKKVYINYSDLANYFLLKDDPWLSDYFFEKCLNIVQDKSHNLDDQFLAEAHSNLGLAHERQTTDYTAKSEKVRESYLNAMEHFQECYNLSNGKDWFFLNRSKAFTKNQVENLHKIRYQYAEDHLKNLESPTIFVDACIHLQRIFRIIADRYSPIAQEKIDLLTKAYQVCKSSFIGSLEGHASFLLGDAYTENKDLDTALACYKNYFDISKRDKDEENFGIASEAIAKCHEKMGQIDKSIEYLEKYLKDAKKMDKQFSRACNCLANIYNAMGKYEQAAAYSKKAFDNSRQLNLNDQLENNRVLVGLAKAHANLKYFNMNVEIASRKTITNILTWKYEPELEEVLKDVQDDQKIE
ncbi:tetratricopeptide repeat 29 [Brachionus plicatilis]|uniref:Tetratricopeptide repeat protein 29 n=1 Tax=Brachionus plicatilis TaxID=10195 RepID=A0A3M7QA40_BRAPC|nr:tetratricopeptide repeat 29 [Brachionus plicatilis]